MKKLLLVISIYFTVSLGFITEALAEAKAYDAIPYSGHLGKLELSLSLGHGYIGATEMYVATQYEAIQLNFSNYDRTSETITLTDSSGGIIATLYLPYDTEKNMEVPDTITVQLQSSNALYNGKTILEDGDGGYQAVDAELNRVYQAVKSRHKNNKAFLQKLKESQRLWIKFRDAEVAMRYPAEDKLNAYGSIYPTCMEALLTELTEARTKTLRQWLDGAVEGEVCSGSIGF